jgi:protein gp37
MSDKSAIEWTDATWNPVTGCSKVSPGCANCYAEALAPRLAAMGQSAYTSLPWTPANAALNVRCHPDRLDIPRRWSQPRRVFVNSMSDLFHELVPSSFIERVWEVMASCPRHVFQVLTKRPERMREWVTDHPEVTLPVLPNVWLGTSVENDRWTSRVNHLRETPAGWRFISAEPLLGPLPSLDLSGIDWLIVGGESGPRARPMQEQWVRDLRTTARSTGVAFFFKQWGGRTPKAGGRELDGQTWDEMPEPLQAEGQGSGLERLLVPSDLPAGSIKRRQTAVRGSSAHRSELASVA